MNLISVLLWTSWLNSTLCCSVGSELQVIRSCAHWEPSNQEIPLDCCIVLFEQKLKPKVSSVELTEGMSVPRQCWDKTSSVFQREARRQEWGAAMNSQVCRGKPELVYACCWHACLPVAGNQHHSQRHRHISVMEERKGPEGPLGPESPPPELTICNQSLLAAGPQACEALKGEHIGWRPSTQPRLVPLPL